MNSFKSGRRPIVPFLLMGCIIVSFFVTHFYFNSDNNPKIENIIDHILLFPVYIVDGILSFLGFNSVMGNPIIVFSLLLMAYSVIVFAICKIYEWRQSEEQ